MGRELWAELSAIVSLIELAFFDSPDYEHATAVVVRCHLRATLHDRPTCWACHPMHWDRATRPRVIPSQSTMSRRLRSTEFELFMRELERKAAHLPVRRRSSNGSTASRCGSLRTHATRTPTGAMVPVR